MSDTYRCDDCKGFFNRGVNLTELNKRLCIECSGKMVKRLLKEQRGLNND